MKKRGFTLAELVVSLTIIGVIAAITAPLINNLIPDKRKMAVLKTYKIITETTKQLLNDSSIYYDSYDGTDNSECSGLNCTGQPLAPPYNDAKYSGEGKYINLLADHLGAVSTNIPKDSAVGSFKTKDNFEWFMDKETKVVNDEDVPTGNLILFFDMDSDNTSNCIFSANCLKPDRFSFTVLPNGSIQPRDSLTKTYLKNPNKLNDSKKDFEEAKKIEGITSSTKKTTK